MRPISGDLPELPPGVEPVGDEAEQALEETPAIGEPLQAPIAAVQERRRQRSEGHSRPQRRRARRGRSGMRTPGGYCGHRQNAIH